MKTCIQCFPEPLITKTPAYVANPAETAALNGHPACLQLAHTQGYPLDSTAAINASSSGNMDCLRYLHKHMPEAAWKADGISLIAAKYGHLDCLTYAIENGVPFFGAAGFAADRGHLNCLKYALEKGASKEYITYLAAQGGHLDCLKYAFENGCPWAVLTTMMAAQGGHLDCLSYAHKNGAPMDNSHLTLYATQSSNIDCLKYLHENGVPWHERITKEAANYNKLDILRYVCENGAPIHPDALSAAAEWGHFECARYLHDKGAPFSQNRWVSAPAPGPRFVKCIANLYYTIPEGWESVWDCKVLWPTLMEHGFCPPTLSPEWNAFTTTRCNVFKYELIKVAWHPKRHVDWCLPFDYQDWFTSINKKRKHLS